VHVPTVKELAELKVARKQGDTIREILDLDVDRIVVPDERLRQVLDADALNRIAESIEEIGQQYPIIVQMVEIDHCRSYCLIAGRHRLEAIRKLGRQTILAYVIPSHLLSSDEAALIEIDDNLARGELTPAERAAYIGKRKQIYEKLHPETVSVRKQGGPGRGKKNESTDATLFPAFIDDAAAKTGKDRATVAKYAAIANAIPDVALLGGTSLDSQVELSVLAKLPAEERASLIEKAKAGEKVSARKTESAIKNKVNPEPKLHRALQAILDLSEVPGEKLQDLVHAAANATEEREQQEMLDKLAEVFRAVEDLMRKGQDTIANIATGDRSTAHLIPTDKAAASGSVLLPMNLSVDQNRGSTEGESAGASSAK
jgi:ParB/RepB/Spo0J family partition protein